MRRAPGFTLIEAMVVLAIVGLTLGLMTIHTGAVREEERSVDRLRLALELAGEEAQIRGVPLLVEFVPQGYRFSRFDTSGAWVRIEDEPLFSEQKLPVEIAWGGLRVDGQPAPPRLVLGAEMPDFELRLRTRHGEVRLVGRPSGAVRKLEQQSGAT